MADNAEHSDAYVPEPAPEVAATSRLIDALRDSMDRARQALPHDDLVTAAHESARRVELAAELAALGAAMKELTGRSPVNAEEAEAAQLAADAMAATGTVEAGQIGPLTDEDWSAARKALGKGSRSIFFGTSDKVIDQAVNRLSKASRSRRRPAPGMA